MPSNNKTGTIVPITVDDNTPESIELLARQTEAVRLRRRVNPSATSRRK